jgi:hypothetical protein
MIISVAIDRYNGKETIRNQTGRMVHHADVGSKWEMFGVDVYIIYVGF